MNNLRARRFGLRGFFAVAALAIAAGAVPAAAQQPLVITGQAISSISGSGSDPNVLLATIPALPGQSITIIRVGIGGDATDSSGPQAFQLVGAGLDFTWGAGQQSIAPQVPLVYTLSPTVVEGGSPSSGRGFTYTADLNQTGSAGQAIEIRWRGTSDWDGLFTWGTDSQGNVFDDSSQPSSARAWVLYRYSGQPANAAQAVPTLGEAALLALAGLMALAGLFAVGRRRTAG